MAALSGPVFSLLMMTGFAHAPLAHGAVIAPACQMLVGIGLSAWLARAPVTRETVLGAAFVLLGLAFMGGDALVHAGGDAVLLGDALFALAGSSWGLFGALSRRWQVDALRVTGVAVVLSFAAFAPFYAVVADVSGLRAAAPSFVALQAVAHGLGAGLVAVLAYSRAAVLLGPGRAAFFGAMVPGAASLLAIGNLFLTYLFTTSFYEQLAKKIFEVIENFFGGKKNEPQPTNTQGPGGDRPPDPPIKP